MSDKANIADYSTTVTILEHMSDAIFILDENGRVEYANRVALDVLRIKMPALIGHNINEFLAAGAEEEEPSAFTGNFIERINRGEFQEIETNLVYRDHRTPVAISFGLVRDKSGRIRYIIASAKDISLRKELEKRLHQQQILAVSRERLKSLGELAVSLVHDLSQPITTLRLILELTQKLLEKPELDLPKIQNNFERMLSLLNTISHSIFNVREFAAQTEDESLKPVRINRILEKANDLISYELKKRNIEFEVQSEEGIPQIMANPITLQQVFVTLVKYVWDGFIYPEHSDDPANKILIHIENAGDKWLEITMDTKPDITESQLHETGAGNELTVIGKDLDLFVVKTIIHALGGDVRQQRGTKGKVSFLIRIPVDQKKDRDQLLNLIELLHKK